MSKYVIVDGELYHYGVKGMKWGVRKKREYADGVYKKAVKKFTNSKIGSKYKLSDDPEKELREVEGTPPRKRTSADAKRQEKANRTPEEKAARRKKAIKVGAAVAATALAAYGAKKLYDLNKDSKQKLAIAKGAAAAEKARKAMEREIAWKNEMMKDAFANGATNFSYQLNYPELGVNSTSTFVNPKLRR